MENLCCHSCIIDCYAFLGVVENWCCEGRKSEECFRKKKKYKITFFLFFFFFFFLISLFSFSFFSFFVVVGSWIFVGTLLLCFVESFFGFKKLRLANEDKQKIGEKKEKKERCTINS